MVVDLEIGIAAASRWCWLNWICLARICVKAGRQIHVSIDRFNIYLPSCARKKEGTMENLANYISLSNSK